MIRSSFLLALLILAEPAASAPIATQPSQCRVAANLIKPTFRLRLVARALADNRLQILVIGAGSSLLPGSTGSKNAYPARLQNALSEKLPGIDVKVATDVKPRRNTVEMVKSLPQALATTKPTLVVWGIGAADAIQGSDPDRFSRALEEGIHLARSAGADVVFINPQYSPRTESMIPLATYTEEMRWVSLQQEVLLFDRYSVMKLWADLGTFDLNSATKKLDVAERIHDCIGRLLADLVLEAAKPSEERK